MPNAEKNISTSKPNIRVLSLDGGGVRGLSSLILLRDLMNRITVKQNAPATLRPCDYFDLIIGTGMGGISALFLGRMQMTIGKVINAYVRVGEHGLRKSSSPLLQRLRRKEALFDGDSVTRIIGDIVQEIDGDRNAQLQDRAADFCRTAVLATSSADASAPPFIFRSYRTYKDLASTDCIHQAARATVATAGASPPISIGSPPIQFIDAGVAGYNNPSEVALDEITRIWPGAKIACLVSLGTGIQNIVRVDERSEDVTQVAKRLVDDCEKVHHRLLQRSHRDRLPYFRFNVTHGLDGADVREWDKKTSGFIADVTAGYARKPDVDAFLTSCASLLIGNISDSISQEYYETRSHSELYTIKDDALDGKIAAWLNAPDSSSSYIDACNEHQEGTGDWFIRGEPFSNWQKDRASFLCVYGNAGSGKTILCSSIISHIADICDGDASRAYAYFFFDGRNVQTAFQQLDGLIRSLIQQFVDQCDGIPSTLVELYGKGHMQPSNNALEDILQPILAGFKDAYIIIDSLDECTETRKLVAWINKITSSTWGKSHLLSLSRPERDIMDSLTTPHARIFMEDFVKDDIEKYIHWNIRTEFDERHRILVKDALTRGAHGMFRWVALQLEELRRCPNPKALEKQLAGMPGGLDEIYERILLRIDEHRRDDAKRFFLWIALSTRPLTPKELAEVVAVDFEDPNGPTCHPSKYRNQADISRACSSLITLSRDSMFLNELGPYSVKFAHISVREYLISDRIANGAAKYFSIHEKLSHRAIAETSLAYLLQLDSPEPLEPETLAAFPLARYAASNWVFHVRSGGGEHECDIYKRITTLLESGNAFTNWIRLWNPEDSWRPALGQLATEIAAPLYYASLLGFTEVSRQLLQHGASVNGQRNGEHSALARGSCVLYGNALQAACAEGHREVVELLLEHGANVEVQGGKYGNALHAAAYSGHDTIVNLLIDRGAEIDAQGGYYGSPLQAAAYSGHDTIVNLLLERGADFDVQGGEYGSAIQAAASNGHEATVKLLVDSGADINIQDGLYGSALQAAAFNGHEAITKLLLECGVDVDVRGGVYGSALQAAAFNGHEAIVKLLLECGADANTHGGLFGCALQAAAFKGDPSVERGLRTIDSQRKVSGSKASIGGHLEIIERLLANRAYVNAQGGAGGNPLMAASIAGHDDVVELLLEHGADVNAPAKDCADVVCETPDLGTATQRVKEKEADADFDGEYKHALQAASHGGHSTIVKTLLAHGADVNAQGGTYGNAIRAALNGKHDEIVKLLLENGATPKPDPL